MFRGLYRALRASEGVSEAVKAFFILLIPRLDSSWHLMAAFFGVGAAMAVLDTFNIMRHGPHRAFGAPGSSVSQGFALVLVLFPFVLLAFKPFEPCFWLGSRDPRGAEACGEAAPRAERARTGEVRPVLRRGDPF